MDQTATRKQTKSKQSSQSKITSSISEDDTSYIRKLLLSALIIALLYLVNRAGA